MLEGTLYCLGFLIPVIQGRMGYLGLDETPVKDDNLFQRMFWPSDHPGEADTLGQQGFWVCTVIAAMSCVVLVLQGHPILAVFTGGFYFLGGIGVREHSQPTAILVAVAYILEMVVGLTQGMPPGALTLIASLLLLANVRGTYIAAKWAGQGDPETMPERRNETFSDKFVDQMPMKVWPKARIAFFCVAGLYVALTLLGAMMLAMHVPHRIRARQAQEAPSTTLDVTPSR